MSETTSNEQRLKNSVAGIKKAIEISGVNDEHLESLAFLCHEATRQRFVQNTASLTIKKNSSYDRKYWMSVSKYIKAQAERKLLETQLSKYARMYDEMLLWEAPQMFESYLLYMEKDRKPEKRFYWPRRKTLKVVVDDLQRLEDGELEFYGLSLPARVGKALAYDTPVLTDNGWKNHGDLTIRDRVIGLDGEFKDILAIHNPCEMEYRVTFSDGEEIVCHGNHEWILRDRNAGKNVQIETKELAKKYKGSNGRLRYFVPEINVVEGTHTPVWVDPYTLGVWLGDGRNQNPDFCGPESDYAIVQKVIDNGYELAWQTKHKTTGVRYYGFKCLREDLQHYGMCHSRQRTPKYIPSEYLTADVEQRLELLAGLLDTDGTLSKTEGRYLFSTTEPRLRDDFVTLISSFGWRASVTSHEPRVSSSGVHGKKICWVIGFNPDMYIPCQLERKQLKDGFHKHYAISVEKVEKIEGRHIYGNCITVDGGIYLVGKTLKPTHNSTLCIFFLSWVIGRHPNSHNAMGGHSGILSKGFYKEIVNIITSREYHFLEIFPHAKVQDKSSEDFTVNLADPDRFPTLTCRGIDGTWTGAVDVSSDGYLYVDDLIRDREESLSAVRLEAKYQEYLNVMVDRKNDGAKELMVGTRWNLYDVLGRREEKLRDNPKALFRKIPALNENDESNFDYDYHVGFSTEYYKNMRDLLDQNEWQAKFQQTPYLREGLVLPAEELRYYNGVLPEGDRQIAAACDVAFGGGDSLSMPIGVKIGEDIYVTAWVHNSGDKFVTRPLVVNALVTNDVSRLQIEGNNGGTEYAEAVDKMLRERGHVINITTPRADNQKSKGDKIIQYAPDIKKNFVFLERSKQPPEYAKAFQEATTHAAVGKNLHDDAIDGLTQLSQLMNGDRKARIQAVLNPLYM